MSFSEKDESGNTVDNGAIKDKCNWAYANNVLLIASSGNDNRNQVNYPARYESVIAVGALDSMGSKRHVSILDESGSNYGPNLELMAVGERVYSADICCEDCKYSAATGTSFAAPQVAGVAALVMSGDIPSECDTNGNNKWDAIEVRKRLRDTADNLSLIHI